MSPPPAPRKARRSFTKVAPSYIQLAAAVDFRNYDDASRSVSTQELIGRGSFGAVYRVLLVKVKEDEKDEVAALKVQPMPFDDMGDKRCAIYRYIKSRVCEVTNLPTSPASLVVCKRVWWSNDNHLYTLMSLCEGVSTRAVAENNAFTEAHAWGLLADVGQALMHLHTHDLLFNDVKPENIQMTVGAGATPRAKFALVDLDSITCTRPGSLATDTDRTGVYEAPETMNGAATSTSDVYSLGLSVRHLTAKIQRRSEELEQLLTIMSAQDQTERPTLAHIIDLALMHLQQQQQ